MPRIVGRMVSGVQMMPTIVASTVPVAARPQNKLTMPLASVVQAITLTRVGFGVFIKISYMISLSYTPHQEIGCRLNPTGQLHDKSSSSSETHVGYGFKNSWSYPNRLRHQHRRQNRHHRNSLHLYCFYRSISRIRQELTLVINHRK